MSSTKKAFGLLKARNRGSSPNNMATSRWRVGVSAPSAILAGDPVARTVTGTLAPATAVTDTVVGVAAGFQYVDPTTKRPVWTQNLVAGTSSADSNIWADIYDGEQHTFYVGTDASCSFGDIGYNYALSGVGTANAMGGATGVLKISSRASGISTGYRLLGFGGHADNVQGDAYMVAEVRVVLHDDTKVSAF